MPDSIKIPSLPETDGPKAACASLRFATITDLRAGLDAGLFTSKHLTDTYMARIREVNDILRPVSQLSSNATSTAELLDAELAAGKRRGPLHGIPVLIKDMINTTDDMHSSAGCTGLVDARPRSEATVVSKLREAGAIIMGKATTSQWAKCRSEHSAPNGWSPTTGQCLGVFCDNQDPSGSSSGSAVAMSLGLAAVTLGTETQGSIITPSSWGAVVGFKPTVGVVSRHGIYIVSRLQDSVGVIGASVMDVAMVLNVIAGPDEKDNFTIKDTRDTERIERPLDYTTACAQGNLVGLRIGVPRHVFPPIVFRNQQLDGAVSVLANLGATIVDDVKFSEFYEEFYDDLDDEWHLSFLTDLRDNMKDFLASFETNPHDLHTLADLIKYTAETPTEMATEYGMDMWQQAEKVGQENSPDSAAVKASRERRRHMQNQIPELLDKYSCDLLVLPGATQITAELGGCPVLLVPLACYPEGHPVSRNRFGRVETGPGVPFGIEFVGRRHSDLALLRAGHAFEQATAARRKIMPVMEPKTELWDGEATSGII
ncbi:amidase signature domain-containing protein [Bombardia bombarda]|uniref:Amidase signature domain-containing protein n=1 Tax=Bombardia bombarda TaxID=252184 RepID=A0AA39WH11_9PEZI|nr:amidase signature domain-containing protein [Bombardia bombarda]